MRLYDSFWQKINRDGVDSKSGEDLVGIVWATIYMVALFSLLSIVMFFGRYSKEVVTMVRLTAIFWAVFLAAVLRFKRYRLFVYIFIVITNFLIIPMFYFLGGTVFNGVEFFFCLGIVITFFLIVDKWVYLLVVLEIIWYYCLLVFSSQNMSMEINIISRERGIIVCFIFAATVPIFFITFQTFVFNIQKRNAALAKRRISAARYNKSRLLSNITSEIRTPINAIIGMNELISRENLDPGLKEIDGRIVEASNELLKIINNVLEYSKFESDKVKLYPQKYNFRELIEGVIDIFCNEYTGMASRFRVSIDPGVPKELFGDRTRIRQVFMYILFAAVKRDANKRISLKISTSKNYDDNTVIFNCKIAQTGDGMTKNEVDTVLSGYSSFDSRFSSDFKSIALELSICKEILEKMEGHLNVNSIVDIGTVVEFSFKNYIITDDRMVSIDETIETKALIYIDNSGAQDVWVDVLGGFNLSMKFVDGPNAFGRAIEYSNYTHIFIPGDFYDILKDIIINFGVEERTYVVADREHRVQDYGKCRIIRYPITCINVSDALNGIWNNDIYKTISGKESIIFPKANVLVVDDSIVNLKVLKGILESFEITPDTCKSAEEALGYIKKNFYDLLILDQFMPGIDGIDLLHRIREMSNTNSRVPAICATADFGPEISRRLIAEGFQDYLAKPVQRFYLERILKNYLPIEMAENASEKEDIDVNSVKEEPEEDLTFIDFEKGLETLDGEKEAFYAVLNTYYREGLKKIDEIRNEFKSNDLALYIIDVHALKSSSASIGAFGVSKKFKMLEFAGREKNVELVANETENVLLIFENVLNEVKLYLTQNDRFEDKRQSVMDDAALEELSLSYVVEMQDALNKINLRRCEEIINDLSSRNYGDDINSLVESIRTSYEMFDYHKVKLQISDLIDLVK